MKYFRCCVEVNGEMDYSETEQICENCIDDLDYEIEVIDSYEDEFGDNECYECNVSFNHETMKYEN